MSCILFTLLPAFIFSFLVHLPLSDVYVFISQTVVLYYKRPALEIVWPLGSASKQAELNVVLTVYETTMKKKKHVSSGRFFVKANTDLILKNTHKLMQTDQCNMQFDLSNTNRYCCRCLAFADLNRLHFKAEAHRHHIE